MIKVCLELQTLYFQQSFVHRETYISMVQKQFDINKYNLLSVDVNKYHFMSQENDQLLELVLKYHILVLLRTLLHFANYVCDDIIKLKDIGTKSSI